MNNEDEIKNIPDVKNVSPTGEDAGSPNDSAPLNAEPAPPKPPEPASGYRRFQNPNVFYEPWQEPVYRQAGAPAQEPYSPGIHSGSYYANQRNQVYQQPQADKKTGAWKRIVKVVCLVLICALAAGGATFGVLQLTGGSRQASAGSSSAGAAPSAAATPSAGRAQETPVSAPETPGVKTDLTATGDVMSPEDIYVMATTQVVGVNSEAKTNVFGQISSSPVSGSGFIISSDGYIVTNYHVIQYAVLQGSELTVMMHDGKSYPAKVIGHEPDNDLAVIKVDAAGLNAAVLGTNKNMKVGNKVYTVGNPLGELTYTMTSGIVSALDREIVGRDGTSINMFQIDAAVNPGNSGGPVYNDRGEVIGIVSAKYSSTGIEGLGFAIPIDDANDIISQLMTKGHVSGKPSMGISVSTVTSAAAEYYNLPMGAYVEMVTRGSAADKAGIKVGDVITKMGDEEILTKEDLVSAKKAYKAGDTTTIVVNRQGEELTLSITFDEEGVTATASQGAPTRKTSS